MIDLRSDSVMQPTVAMRQAMAQAMVGDDFYGEDPTTIRLEAEMARLLGMDAAVFTLTGTMANALALFALGADEDGLLADGDSHVIKREMHASSAIGHFETSLVDAPGGTFDLEELDRRLAARRENGRRLPVICTENTHTWRAGAVVDVAHLRRVRALAQRHGSSVHLDGTRLFNAGVALGEPLRALAATADTVVISLCKGLGAPAGAVLAGPHRIIEAAKRLRTVLGGTMRRSGFYAAAALVALQSDWRTRISADHERARQLCGVLMQSPVWAPAVEPSASNIVQISARNSGIRGEDLVAALRGEGILASRLESDTVRLVVHGQISDEDVERTIAALQRVTWHVGSGSTDR
jgi:threonine aldolase